MIQVWFLFKILETIIGSACMIYHAKGFSNKEPLPHIMLFCGTFFGFTLLSLMGTISLAIGNTTTPLIECVFNICAAIMYLLSSIVSMYYAENDFHLMYLSDFEEPLHPYFGFCRSQSICALAAGAMHLLHAILAFDAIFVERFNSVEFSEESESEYDIAGYIVRRPLRMHFLSSYIETKLRKFVWFDNLCERETPRLSVFSNNRRSRVSETFKRPPSKSVQIPVVSSDTSRFPTSEEDNRKWKTRNTIDPSNVQLALREKKFVTVSSYESAESGTDPSPSPLQKADLKATKQQLAVNNVDDSMSSDYSEPLCTMSYIKNEAQKVKIEEQDSNEENLASTAKKSITTETDQEDETKEAGSSQKKKKIKSARFPQTDATIDDNQPQKSELTLRDSQKELLGSKTSAQNLSSDAIVEENEEDIKKKEPKPSPKPSPPN